MKKTCLLDTVCACSFTLISHFVAGAALAIGLLFGIVPNTVQGAPIQLNETDFANQISGLSILVEDFEEFPSGDQTSPMTLANATYTATFPRIARDFILPTNQLINNDVDWDGRLFSGFPTGTTMFGLDIGGIDPTDILAISVVGNGGVLSMEITIDSLNGFIGFQDDLGLLSISFQNFGDTPPSQNGVPGGANYAFDNVTTGIVPIPAAAWLFVSGMLGLIGITIRKQAA